MLTQPQVDLQTQHMVFAGMYARTILIPKGVMLTGALTKMDNVCVILGDITVTTDEGTQRLTGYHMIKAQAGAKRAGIAHEDTFWTTLIPTNLTDIQEIEAAMTDEADKLQTRTLSISTMPASQLEH